MLRLGMLLGFARGLLPRRGRRAVRRRPRREIRRFAGPEAARVAYGRTARVERRSVFAHDPIDIPAYEARARTGKRAPHRFRWRGRWYRVVDVSAVWRDGRKATAERPEQGRAYFGVTTATGTYHQIYYEQPGKRERYGRWMMYRTVATKPASGSTAATPALN